MAECCPLCDTKFSTTNARTRHMRNIWKSALDPSRCDNKLRRTQQPVVQVPLITEPNHVLIGELTQLARRKPCGWADERALRAIYAITEDNTLHTARDMTVLQHHWDQYLKRVAAISSSEFWQLFLNLHTCSGAAIDGTLRVVKKVYITGCEQKKFPISRRSLLKSMSSLPAFWPRVLHSCVINVSQFNLPSGTTTLDFRFVDPVWAWIQAARRQHPLEMHWKPAAQRVGCEKYGGGIQYGECFKHICSQLPRDTFPMCVGLNWDGTTSRSISSSHMYWRRKQQQL